MKKKCYSDSDLAIYVIQRFHNFKQPTWPLVKACFVIFTLIELLHNSLLAVSFLTAVMRSVFSAFIMASAPLIFPCLY